MKKFDEEEQEAWVKEEEKRNKVGLRIHIKKRKRKLRMEKKVSRKRLCGGEGKQKNARGDNEIIQKQSEMTSRKQNERAQRQTGDREGESVEHG